MVDWNAKFWQLDIGAVRALMEQAVISHLITARYYVNVGFSYGAALDDPARLLEGAGKRMRRVKLRWAQPINEAALSELIAAAYRDIRLRLGTPS